MDVCAFLGVAPRGPAWEPVVEEDPKAGRSGLRLRSTGRRTVPVAVESFPEYLRMFGGFELPSRLPYAVAAFFDQGGRRAYVARIVHDYSREGNRQANKQGWAVLALPALESAGAKANLRARNEGGWGNQLRAGAIFSSYPLPYSRCTTIGLTLTGDLAVPVGVLLRLSLQGGQKEFRFVSLVRRIPIEDRPERALWVTFDRALPALPESAEIVETELTLDDGDGRSERHRQLGLSPSHPRWLGRVLCFESILAYPDFDWLNKDLLPKSLDLAGEESFVDESAFVQNRSPDITPEDFFDDQWTLGNDEAGSGVQCLAGVAEVALVCAPDLYSPFKLVKSSPMSESPTLAGDHFTPCVRLQSPTTGTEITDDLAGLSLDPRLPDDLLKITGFQSKLVDFAEMMRSFVVLLDVPPGIPHRSVLEWRNNFASSYVAAYHPWLQVSRLDDKRDALIAIPPSSVAAGVIACQENAFGLPYGPANVLAVGVLDTLEAVSMDRQDELHPLGVNIFQRERDGVRLTAARTLSRTATYRQLSVRRVIDQIRRTLEQEMQWVVFEPNNEALRADVRHFISAYLRHLFRLGAFRGGVESDSFFVRCDEENNPPEFTDNGRLLAEIGVAPAEPLEFIAIRLTREGNDILRVEA